MINKNEKIKEFTDLEVWKAGHSFVLGIHKLVGKLPKNELFGLTAQLRRSAVSITSNIAEGFSRYYFKDKVRFYYMARGSVSEVQNLLIIARDLEYIDGNSFDNHYERSSSIQQLLNGLIRAVSKQFDSNHF